MKKFYNDFGAYIEKEFGVTEFYYRNKRITKTSAGVWVAI